MSSYHFIIEKIDQKNDLMSLCFFEPSVYNVIKNPDEWKPVKRVLMDSDQKHLVYVVDTPHGWENIRFPLSLWKKVDQLLVKDQDLLLVTSVTADGEAFKSILLKEFQQECRELIQNMRHNANYGKEMSDLVEEHFARTLIHLK